MKINVDVKWSEEELCEILTRELAKHNLKPREDGFSWEMTEGREGTEVEVSVQAEYLDTKDSSPGKKTPQLSMAVAAEQPIDMSTLYKYVPKEAVGPLTRILGEESDKISKRETLPGESPKRP